MQFTKPVPSAAPLMRPGDPIVTIDIKYTQDCCE